MANPRIERADHALEARGAFGTLTLGDGLRGRHRRASRWPLLPLGTGSGAWPTTQSAGDRSISEDWKWHDAESEEFLVVPSARAVAVYASTGGDIEWISATVLTFRYGSRATLAA